MAIDNLKRDRKRRTSKAGRYFGVDLDWAKLMVKRLITSIGLMGAGVAGIAGLLFLAACDEPADPDRSRPEKAAVAARPQEEQIVHLYFSDSDQGVLMAEPRSMPAGIQSAKAGAWIMKAMLEGPRQRLQRTIPAKTRLRGMYLLANRTAYVDLSTEIREHHPGGARSELLTIFSIVNSLTMNLTEIDTVKIIVGGQEATTLVGHMDLRFPLRANLLYVR